MEMENEAWIGYIAQDLRIEIEGLVENDDDVDMVEDIIENMDGDAFRLGVQPKRHGARRL